MSRKGVSKTEAYKVYQVGRVFCTWLHTVDIGLFQMSGSISEDIDTLYIINYFGLETAGKKRIQWEGLR